MWIGHSYLINFCHFFCIVNLVIFHPEYTLTVGVCCERNSSNTFETLCMFSSWYEDVHVVCI